jgi:Tfp pilus assembly protein PilV
MQLRPTASSGVSLVETTIAAAIAALFLSSVFALNISTMETIRSAKETIAASQVLQQRMESLRIANWQEITSPDWVTANLLNTSAAGSVQLRSLTESMLLVPYGSNSVGNTLITRAGNAAAIVSRDDNLLTENAIKVIWTVNYTGVPNERATSRQAVVIIAKGGVAK